MKRGKQKNRKTVSVAQGEHDLQQGEKDNDRFVVGRTGEQYLHYGEQGLQQGEQENMRS